MTGVDRRSFLTTAIASLGLASNISGISGVSGVSGISGIRGDRLAVFAQTAAPARPQRIDIHHHFAPPAWIAEVKGRPLLQPANANWTPAKSLDDMDRGGVAAAVVSITNPGLWFGDAAVTRRLETELAMKHETGVS